MAQLVITDITIEGKSIRQFRSLKLDQAISAHHTFQLICPAEAIDGKTGAVFGTSGNWIGADIYIKMTAVSSRDCLLFAGIITQVSIARSGGHAGDIIVSGAGPTILLDNGPHCKSWNSKVLKNIVQDVLKHFPSNRLQPRISPVYRETISYIVQYKESAWQFLNRIAACYGEWFYYNGRHLVMGSPQGNKTDVVYGVHLSRFTVSMLAQPVNFRMLAYDYMHHAVYHGAPEPENSITANWSRYVLEKSRLLYTALPKQWHNQFITNKKQLTDFIRRQAAWRNSHMIRCNGSSDLPGIQPGVIIHVQGKNMYTANQELFGDFIIVSVQHACNGRGHYSNDFVAVPSSVEVPPVTHFPEPRCETQSALVTDNYDSRGLGRVRVRFHWMNGNEKSPWLRVATPHAGNGKGWFSMPEIGEEVLVGFEGDHPAKPYVIGSVYHGNATCAFSTEENDVKIFQSRSGNKILLDDGAGSVLIEDQDGNRLKLDGTGAVQVISRDRIVLSCGEATIEMKKDGVICLNAKKIAVTGNDLVTIQGNLIKLN